MPQHSMERQMATTRAPQVSQIAVQAASSVAPAQSLKYIPRPLPRRQAWAPVWFYSALNFLGESYFDASNTERRFAQYLVGSDVDPYTALGSTRLFMVIRVGSACDPDVLILFLAAQNPNAPFVNNQEINLVFAKDIVSYFNAQQLTLVT